MPECTPLDHSGFVESTNYWAYERIYPEQQQCPKCGKWEYNYWLQCDEVNKVDWKRTGAEYWREVFKRPLVECFWRSHIRGHKYVNVYCRLDRDSYDEKSFLRVRPNPKQVIKDVRDERYRRRLPRKKVARPIEDYGFVRGILLQRHIERMIEDLDEPCLDNVRFAASNSRREMRRYRRQQSNGCCGSHDEEVSICGKKFWIGCNYGH